MKQNQNESLVSKHYRSFWPIVIVFVVGVVFGAGILYTINDYDTQSDLGSVNFTHNLFGISLGHKTPAAKLPSSTPVSKIPVKAKPTPTPVK